MFNNDLKNSSKSFIENCAEIWAVRNTLLVGAKLENLVIRTLQVPLKKLLAEIPADEWQYAAPCNNCKEIFKEFLIKFNE